MKNRELLIKLLDKKEFSIKYLELEEIKEIITFLKRIYNIKQNTISAWNGVYNMFNNMDYLTIEARLIKMGSGINYSKNIDYKTIKKLMLLEDDEFDLKNMKDIL